MLPLSYALGCTPRLTSLGLLDKGMVKRYDKDEDESSTDTKLLGLSIMHCIPDNDIYPSPGIAGPCRLVLCSSDFAQFTDLSTIR